MLPVDALPEVAAIRAEEFGRAMANAKFASFPPPWKLALVMAFEDARKAAGKATIAEQQQAQAQAQAQQAAQQAAQLGAKSADADKARQHEAQQKDAERQHASREQAIDRDHAMTQARAGNATAIARAEMQTAARQGTMAGPAPSAPSRNG